MLSAVVRSALLAVGLAAGVAYCQPYVEDSIDVGGAWVGGLCYNSASDVVYGGCQYGSGIFFAIACASNEVVSTWAIPWPRGMTYDSTDNKCYVAYRSDDEDSVMVIDGRTHARLRAIPVPDARLPLWEPVNNRVYVSCCEINRVSVIDCVADTVMRHIRVGTAPVHMVLNSQRRKLYAENWDAGTVSVIDLRTDSVIRTVLVGGVLEAEGCYSANLDKFYVGGERQTVVMDGLTDSVVKRVPHGLYATDYACAVAHNRVMVGTGGLGGTPDTLLVIDATADSVVSRLPVGSEAQDVVWSAGSDLVYCANYRNSVSVILGDGSRVITTLPVSRAPHELLLVPRHRRIYISHLNSRWVYVVRATVLGVEEAGAGFTWARERLVARPNPFRDATVFTAEERVRVPLRIYDIDGVLVAELAPAQSGGGRLIAVWDGRNATGREVPPGVYFVRQDENNAASARLVKVR